MIASHAAAAINPAAAWTAMHEMKQPASDSGRALQ